MESIGNITGDSNGKARHSFIFQRILSVVWSGGKLGSAYYDTETSQLYLQMDVIETNDFQFLKRGTPAILFLSLIFPF